MSAVRLLIEAIAVVAFGVALSVLLYSDLFRTCCIDWSRDVLALLAMPAILFAYVIGGVHEATKEQFTLGLVLELLCVWIAVRLVRRALARRQAMSL